MLYQEKAKETRTCVYLLMWTRWRETRGLSSRQEWHKNSDDDVEGDWLPLRNFSSHWFLTNFKQLLQSSQVFLISLRGHHDNRDSLIFSSLIVIRVLTTNTKKQVDVYCRIVSWCCEIADQTLALRKQGKVESSFTSIEVTNIISEIQNFLYQAKF